MSSLAVVSLGGATDQGRESDGKPKGGGGMHGKNNPPEMSAPPFLLGSLHVVRHHSTIVLCLGHLVAILQNFWMFEAPSTL